MRFQVLLTLRKHETSHSQVCWSSKTRNWYRWLPQTVEHGYDNEYVIGMSGKVRGQCRVKTHGHRSIPFEWLRSHAAHLQWHWTWKLVGKWQTRHCGEQDSTYKDIRYWSIAVSSISLFYRPMLPFCLLHCVWRTARPRAILTSLPSFQDCAMIFCPMNERNWHTYGFV